MVKNTKRKYGYGPKVGFTCGSFDLLHTGHVLMLKEAKDVCDFLIVGVQSDPTIDRPEKNKPIDIDVYFNSRNHDWSTSYLRQRVYEAEKNKDNGN